MCVPSRPSPKKEEKLTGLAAVNIPKLFISGAFDKAVPPESAKHEARVGGFDLEIVKSAGHFVHYECPDETMEILGRFLAQQQRRKQ